MFLISILLALPILGLALYLLKDGKQKGWVLGTIAIALFALASFKLFVLVILVAFIPLFMIKPKSSARPAVILLSFLTVLATSAVWFSSKTPVIPF
jgi:hypothetical protein